MSPSHSAHHKRIASQLLRPYQCSFCYKTFQKQNHLTRHTKIHSDERRHKCPYCGKAFLRSDNLKKHVRIHTGEKFPCPFCSRGFTDSSNLTKHIRTHTGEGRHRCKFCLKHFAGLSALQRHVQEHEEEMVFAADTSLTKIERTDDTSNFLSYMEQNGHLNEKEPQRPAYPLILQKTQNSFPENEEPYSDKGNSIMSNLLLVKTEKNDILDYLSHTEQNDDSNENELLQLSQRPASPLLPKRSQDSLAEPYFVNSNLLPQFQEPVAPAVPRKVEKVVNPFKSYSQNILDSSCLPKQSQIFPQKSSPYLDIDKTPFALKDQRLATPIKVSTSDLLQELARPVSASQDLGLWQCVLCLEEFTSCFSLLSHLKGHVTDSIQIQDPWEQDNMMVTEGSSSVEKLNCRYCQKIFTQQSELLAHMDLTLCKNCGTIFACSMLLEKHQDICKINWLDNANNVVISQSSDVPLENYQETDAESQTLDTKDFPLLTAVKQEIIFSDTENAIPDPHLLTSKSILAAAELDCSLNKDLSPISTSPIKNGLIDSTQMLTNANILSAHQEPNPNSDQQISTETIPNNLKESQVFDSGLTASLDLLPKSEPIENEPLSVNPEEPLTLLDSELKNIGQDVPDSTKDFSFNESVYKAYECAKAALNNPNGFQHKDLYSSSTNIQSFWCQNCGRNFQSAFEFREHLKFLQKFIGKSCPENSNKLEALQKSLNTYLPCRASGPLETNLAEDDVHLELTNTENVQRQPFQPQSRLVQPQSRQVQPPNVALNANYNPLSLTCNVCHKKFSRTTQLNRHRKIHFGVKDHKCSFCSKTFLRSDNLKKHLRIHLGIKQYACPICKRRFTDSSNLVKHQRIHNSERQGYFCNLCSRSFLSYKGFYKHNQIHKAGQSTTGDNEVGSASQTFIEEQSITTDKCFADNDVGFASVEIPEKTLTVDSGILTKNNLELEILDADVCDKSTFESGSSKINQFKTYKIELSKKVNFSNNEDCNLTENISDSRDFSSHLKHSTEQEIDSSNSSEQNQISLKSSKLFLNPNYESSPEEFSVYLKPHNVTTQSLGEDRLKTKKFESLIPSNGANQTEKPNLEKEEEWNKDDLQIISPASQESSVTLNSLPPKLSENSQVKPCETSSVNTIFTSLTKQIKDNLTLDIEEKKTYRSPQLESSISEEQKVSCNTELNPIDIESDQNLKTTTTTTTTNHSSCFVSCDSAIKKPILKKMNSDLPESSACFTENPTEDKLEMSAYYSTQTSPQNFVKPISQGSQLLTCLW